MNETVDPQPKSRRKWLVYTTFVLAAIVAVCATIVLRARYDVSEHFRRISHGRDPLNVRFAGLEFTRESWLLLRFEVGPIDIEARGNGSPGHRIIISTEFAAEWGLRQGQMTKAETNEIIY